mmetsp:Transcript_17033/g.25031  ORF Transcript_17033/g.25031 Transcript_17033/m.25031 type:complete len:312 (-) Transcript_17033:81-1016(-)
MGENQKQNNESQFNVLAAAANVEKERRKELEYKKIFMNLLEKKRDIFTSSLKSDKISNVDEYEEERKVLKRVMKVERDSLIGAAVLGIAAFATVRYLPKIGIRVIGGKSRFEAMKAAEAKSHEASPALAFARSVFAFALEGSFGFWAAYKGFGIAVDKQVTIDNFNTERSTGTIQEEIIKLPLVQGKSLVSETICDEWTKIVKYRVPKDFWKAVEMDSNTAKIMNTKEKNDALSQSQSRIRQGFFWDAVLRFESACAKRKYFEDLIRKNQTGASMNERNKAVAVPSPGIPENILFLSDEEVDALLEQTLKN